MKGLSELDSVINRYVQMKKQGEHSRRNICQKIRYMFINIRDRIKIMKFTKRH